MPYIKVVRKNQKIDEGFNAMIKHSRKTQARSWPPWLGGQKDSRNFYQRKYVSCPELQVLLYGSSH